MSVETQHAGRAALAPRVDAALVSLAGVACQLLLLWTIGRGLNLLVIATALPLPGNAIAMLAVFALLACGVLRLAWIERTAALLVRHLALFFVPFAVDILRPWDQIAQVAMPLAIVIAVSAACGIGTAALIVQRVRSGRRS